MSLPKYLRDESKNTPQVRGRKQESRIAKVLNGKVSVNSGATFGQNDILLAYGDVESKLTTKKSFALNIEYFKKVRGKAGLDKIPMMHINFENYKEDLIVLPMDDFKMLIDIIESKEE